MTSDELKAWLTKHKLDKIQFAKVIGVTGPAVDHWLTARRRMPKIAVKMCRVLDQYPQLIPWVGGL